MPPYSQQGQGIEGQHSAEASFWAHEFAWFAWDSLGVNTDARTS